MQPRLLFRTHYQVEEPAYMEFLIKRCTSPIQSAYAEAVAARLKEEIERRCRIRFNLAASGYAVDLGKALGLLTANNTWTEQGHLVNLVAKVDDKQPKEQLLLNPMEKILHFRLFFEADGAAFVLITRYLKEHGELVHAEVMSSPIIEKMFIEIFTSYLSMTSNTADRVVLRSRIDQLRSKGYAGQKGSGKTRQHKLHIHMQTLYRLGLVERLDGPDGLVYRLPSKAKDGKTGLDAFVREVPDLPTLEKKIAGREWAETAAKVLELPHQALTSEIEELRDEIFGMLIPFYQQIMSLGTPICPLASVIEAVQIRALVERGSLIQYEQVAQLVMNEQKQRPRDIRLHVDRRGQPAFIKLSEQWITSFTNV